MGDETVILEEIPAKNIVNRVKNGKYCFGYDYNMNIYRGCCHGCIYCDSRSGCYGTLDFDRVRVKADALRLIRDGLRSKRHPGVVGMGAMSDPYNPFEKEYELTRHALELISAVGLGAGITTKRTLITRDLDVLQEIAAHAPVLCKLTITAADDRLSRKVEPYAPPSSQRFEALRRLTGAGLFAGVLLMPVLPFLEDTEENVRTLVGRAADCGARFVYPAFGMTLRANQRIYYYDRLAELFPGLRERYEKRYGERYQCASPRARQLWGVFQQECARHGLLYRMPEIIRGYRLGYQAGQLSLF